MYKTHKEVHNIRTISGMWGYQIISSNNDPDGKEIDPWVLGFDLTYI